MTHPRLEKLYNAMAASGLEAVAINPGPTLAYITGLSFHLMERPVVMFLTPGKDPAIILPELESPKLGHLPYQAQAFPYPELPGEWIKAFQKGIQALGIGNKAIGVEPRALRILEYRFMQQAAPEASFPDASTALAALRITKDAAEIAKMRRAVVIAQDALKACIPQIKIGMREKELAAELTIQLLRNGSSPEIPFSPIVSSGPNSANPHAAPSDRKLQAGDMLVVDWGAAYEGYISDLTRTFAIGEVDPEYKKIHQIVQEANAAGRAAGKPGAACAAVDKAARDVIEKSGYGVYFNHRTGHGIGMEGHEDPYMRGDNMQILEPGMCYTVEPGIYLTERNGVRIEDNMVVTENGTESMSDMKREFQTVG
ncbi:MAG: aminopeptidase P family protein [Chloroflexi bacterium]|nr:aminopeptidase P family protein [Chloroflexota bacterium]